WVVDVARRNRRRLMVRLVKGAYWDSEIKRAQVDGLEGYPVFTRKVHTDVAYLACARAMLAAPDAVYPQFASHNAFTIAAIHTLAGSADYEFQCLHGMGESMYDQIVGEDKLNRACRVYAPVGSHETLLAYLVRRLLENGANTSFVNRIVDPAIEIAELVADPVAQARAKGATPHPRMPAAERAHCLEGAADLIEQERGALLALAVREAGKTLPNALGEVREAADFCRYYAMQARRELADATPRGPLVCIAPWNFPLA